MEHSKHKKIKTEDGYMMPLSHMVMPDKKHKKEMDKMMKNKKSKTTK